jgi:dTDP-4-amino-4,6-dideoxy-D-galactose acyltransferase
MNKGNFEFKKLSWDSEYFGIPSCKVVLNNSIDSNDKLEIENFITEFEFVSFTNINNNNLNNYWLSKQTNAHLVDVNVQFEKVLSNVNQLESNAFLKNDLMYKSDIAKIAEESFIESRFYNDVFLDKKKASKIYVEWVKNSFNNPEKFFIYTQINDKITSFLLFSISENYQIAIIELIAVDNEYQNKKYGKELLRKLESYLSLLSIKVIKVGTQINNINAINFYIKNGFKLKECHSIYHYWPKKHKKRE